MNKAFVIGVIILLALVGGYYVFSHSTSTATSTGNVISNSGDVKTFVIDSSHFRFYMNGVENPDIKVKEGDKVRIEFTSSEGLHDWKVDEFNAATKRVNPGASSSVEFVANKKGTFEYYCSVGQHRANGMKGKLIVE